MGMTTRSNKGLVWDAMVALAQNLKAIRTERGLSQEDLAVAVGISYPRISEIESGKGNPRIKTLEKIAKALKVELTALMAPPEKCYKKT